MVFTCPHTRQAFSHILDSLLEKDDSSPLKQALIAQGIEDMISLVSIDEDTIDSLVYD
jgi:Zn-dependent M16 (insulinase) family peptidase